MAQQLAQRELKYSYRFLFVPGTIGAITWAAIRQSHLNKIKHGFVLTCAGDAGAPTYKRSRRHDAEIDRAWSYVLNQSGEKFHMQPFSPYGYDERQYCSPGLDLPIGAFMRTPYGEFPEYHTSADNLEFVDAKAMHDSCEKALTVIDVLEHNRIYFNLKPLCEPKLGDYGLYSSIGGTPAGEFQMAILWLLNMSDGTKSLLDVAERCNLTWGTLKKAVQALVKAQLLRPIDQLVDGGSDARANLTLVAPLAEPNSI
jgi:aminopeptidase-like protein